MNKKSQAIGMFDSGIGGLTVLKVLQERLPQEEIVYFGDTARQFYGEKSPETVLRYSIENSIFLMDQTIKVLVIACNTASAVSVERLRKIFNIPVIGVIEPGAEAALKATKTGHIAVLGTKGTIRSHAYQDHIHKLSPKSVVLPLECPLLAPLVEEGMLTHPATRLILKDYLKSIYEYPVDTVLLGCTHYPLLRKLIQEEVGDRIQIIDSAITCAEKVKEALDLLQLRNEGIQEAAARYFVSDNPEKFKHLGEFFLGKPLNNVFLRSSTTG